MAAGFEAGFLRSNAARILTIVLVAQAALLYGFSRSEIIPEHTPLSNFPAHVGKWGQISEGVIEKEVQDVLRADDLLNRSYASPSHRVSANLFVAFFKTQRTGQAPHSPKNCLPGSGWVPSESNIVSIDVPGRSQPIEANRYIVQRGDNKSLVLYWYQSRDRVVADEYTAKFFVVADAIRYNRTDTALVRVVVPVPERGEPEAEQAAVAFVRAFFAPLRQHFPA